MDNDNILNDVRSHLHHYDNVIQFLKVKTDPMKGISFLYNGKPCFNATVSNELLDEHGNKYFQFNIDGKKFRTNAHGYDIVKNMIHNYIYSHFNPKQLVRA